LAQDAVEPVLANAVRPVAEKILSDQQQADLPSFNRRYDSGYQAAQSAEQLQHRDDADLPPVPTLEPGGDPDLWRQLPTMIEQPAPPNQLVDARLQELDGQLQAQAREEHPEWYAQDQGW
jgi:hypothetical protein